MSVVHGMFIVGDLINVRSQQTKGGKPYKHLQIMVKRADGSGVVKNVYDYDDNDYSKHVGKTVQLPIWASAYTKGNQSGNDDARLKFMVSKAESSSAVNSGGKPLSVAV